MTNKQLYNLVFENFVQAKKELIREGYFKKNLDEVDFNEIFDQTKKRMLEEKVKSLQRENEMLKIKLAKKQLTKENLLGNTGNFETGGAGTETVGTGMDRIGAFFKDKGSIAILATKELDKAKFFDRMMDRYPNTSKKGLIDAFKFTMVTNLKNGMSKDEAKRKAMADMDNTLTENRRRRRY